MLFQNLNFTPLVPLALVSSSSSRSRLPGLASFVGLKIKADLVEDFVTYIYLEHEWIIWNREKTTSNRIKEGIKLIESWSVCQA